MATTPSFYGLSVSFFSSWGWDIALWFFVTCPRVIARGWRAALWSVGVTCSATGASAWGMGSYVDGFLDMEHGYEGTSQCTPWCCCKGTKGLRHDPLVLAGNYMGKPRALVSGHELVSHGHALIFFSKLCSRAGVSSRTSIAWFWLCSVSLFSWTSYCCCTTKAELCCCIFFFFGDPEDETKAATIVPLSIPTSLTFSLL